MNRKDFLMNLLESCHTSQCGQWLAERIGRNLEKERKILKRKVDGSSKEQIIGIQASKFALERSNKVENTLSRSALCQVRLSDEGQGNSQKVCMSTLILLVAEYSGREILFKAQFLSEMCFLGKKKLMERLLYSLSVQPQQSVRVNCKFYNSIILRTFPIISTSSFSLCMQKLPLFSSLDI